MCGKVGEHRARTDAHRGCRGKWDSGGNGAAHTEPVTELWSGRAPSAVRPGRAAHPKPLTARPE